MSWVGINLAKTITSRKSIDFSNFSCGHIIPSPFGWPSVTIAGYDYSNGFLEIDLFKRE